MTESQLQSQCNAMLRKHGILFYHCEKGRGRNLTHRGGWPDLLIFHRGMKIAIELKVPGGVISKEQKEMSITLGYEGFRVYVCWSYSDFEDLLRTYKIIV